MHRRHTGHIQNKFFDTGHTHYRSESKYFSDTSLVGGDTLTCGECKKDFKLQELTLFIQHKALNSCKKIVKQPKSVDTDFEDVRMSLMINLSFIFYFLHCRSSLAHPRTEIMFLWGLLAFLVQVEHISRKSRLILITFVAVSGQTECDTNSSDNGSQSVKIESSDNNSAKKYLFSDAQTNTVSSSGRKPRCIAKKK